MWTPMPMFLLQRSRPTRRGGWNSGWTCARRLRQGLPGCQVALVVDEVCEPQLADQVRRAKKDGLIDGFFYSSVSSDYLSAMIDAL